MRRLGLLVALVAGSLTACSAGAECLEVSQPLLVSVSDRLAVSEAAAVRSVDAAPDDAAPIFQEDLWFVAMETDQGPAVFSVVKDPTSSSWTGPIFATNDLAASETELGVDVPSRPTMEAEGAEEAVSCLDG